MSIQDDSFEIQRKLSRYKDTDYIHRAWNNFRTWAYELEEENSRLRTNLNACTKVIAISKQCICGKPLSTANNIFCVKCQKLPRDVYGFPVRKR